MLDTLRNPALLNYYFFFPAHEEALASGCSNVEATEFGAFAGEWACMSVAPRALTILKEPSKAQFDPSILGFSGRFLDPADPLSAAQAPADNDAAKRLVMKVVPFIKARLIDRASSSLRRQRHPRLYLGPGPFNVVYGPGLEPYSCTQEQFPPPKQPESIFTMSPEPLIAKLLAARRWVSWVCPACSEASSGLC